MAPPAEFEVSDPTDWTPTSLPSLSPLDSALRCQVCKDFYNNAVITSCAHSFCSLCIRRCLAADGQCPACRAKEQEVRLRRNTALQEVVDAFNDARAGVLALARNDAQLDRSPREHSRGQKRKRTAEHTPEGSQRQTRRSTRNGGHISHTPSSTQEGAADEPVVIDEQEDNHTDGEYKPEPEDGLVPCPMCGKRMKEEQVFAHLDRCETEKTEEENRIRDKASSTAAKAQRRPEEPPPERLPALNYALYNDTKLKQRLKALGISNAGSKALMSRRHTEWINLWNANCDSPRPVSRRELLSELDKWERSQGGLSQNGGVDNSTIMKKDFDGQAWASKNKSNFDSLIQQARAKRARAAAAAAAKDPEPDESLPSNPVPDSNVQPVLSDDDELVEIIESDALEKAKVSDQMQTEASTAAFTEGSPGSIQAAHHNSPRRESAQSDLHDHVDMSGGNVQRVPMREVPLDASNELGFKIGNGR